MMQFCDLHLHSTYSCLDGYGTAQQIVARAKELGRKSIAITDHASISGYVQFDKECKAAGIKPIFGYEAYITSSISKMVEDKKREKEHITLLAENEDGYRNILKLATLAYQEGFYYKPTIDYRMLFDNSKGVILLSGCYSSVFQKHITEGKLLQAVKVAKTLKDVFADKFYLETQHYDLFKPNFIHILSISSSLEIPIVLTCDCHFLRKEDSQMQEILHSIRDRRTVKEDKVNLWGYQWEANELFNYVNKEFPEGNWAEIFDNVQEVANRCQASLAMGEFPKYLGTKDFYETCKEGSIKRNLQNAGNVYRERFIHEKKVIEDKGFIDYLMIAADVVNWAKDNNILVGSGRGSSAGSLICYLLGITELDPIKYNLLFERFIDETRDDPPDIDTDFDAEKRDRVKQYLADTYGIDRICDVATFARFRGKNSLDEIGKVFQIPFPLINQVKEVLIERSNPDQMIIKDTMEICQAKIVSEEYPDILNACSLEGQLRHMSTHAAGVIIGAEALDKTIAVYEREGRKIGSFEMKDASKLGLIKIDLLGLTELSVLRNIAEMINMPVLDIYKIPLDDEETLKGFKECDVEGVFQYEGDTTKKVLGQMPIIDFEQLIACQSLSRPGPMSSGNTNNYISRMMGKDVKGYDWHPILKEVTKSTYGQIIYQEQIIQVLREFANFSREDANKCRQIIAKSKGVEELDKYFVAFQEGTKDKNEPEKSKELWDAIKEFGKYTFNKSHATSYALLSFWSMYMKRHYPIEFYLAKLNYENNDDNKAKLLLDATKNNVQILPPVLGQSGVTWKKEGVAIRAGLKEIRGIGDKTAERLVKERIVSKNDFNKKVKGITLAAYKALESANAFPDQKQSDDYFGVKRYGELDKLLPDRQRIADIKKENEEAKVKIAGLFIKAQLKDYREQRKKKGKSLNFPHPELRQYVIMTLEDGTDSCLVFIDRKLFPIIGQKVMEAYKNKSFVMVRGQKIKDWMMVKADKVFVYNG